MKSLRLTALPILLLALAGCSQKIVVCPIPAILADTSSITVMRPGTAPDLANELYTVSLLNAEGDCTFSTKNSLVHASLDLTFRATRVPTKEAATYTVPYFVVIHEKDKIFQKRLYRLRFTFAPGATSVTIKQSPDETSIQLENGKLPWNYQLLAGFQLTPEQIAYNEKKGRYLP